MLAIVYNKEVICAYVGVITTIITIDIHERGLGTFNASMWLRIGQLAGSYEGSCEPLSAIKFGKFLE
jgi:hypothetical protein